MKGPDSIMSRLEAAGIGLKEIETRQREITEGIAGTFGATLTNFALEPLDDGNVKLNSRCNLGAQQITFETEIKIKRGRLVAENTKIVPGNLLYKIAAGRIIKSNLKQIEDDWRQGN